ncbi:hypothetical protein KIN20_018851 [Parelaphostrongylus tenuis]|uniref:Cytochrome P450 n=1 Tax=Parelaphostrongylus tenuis TaxID=148309 RepID=A0AAD5QPW3_PARTN|nr:hypothetical protein KIN20_018851 [Parelaphostrongylus tenuis]
MILLLTIVFSTVIIIISYYYWQLDYWKRRGIPGPTPTIFIGNMNSLNVAENPVGFVIRDWTKKYGKVFGIQEGLRRTLVVSDVKMIHELFCTKFDYFHGRKVSVVAPDAEKDPHVHLFNARGVRWKRLRAAAGPAFSTGSIKKIHPVVEDSVHVMMELLLNRDTNTEAFDIFPFYKEFTMDVIYRLAIGQRGSKMFTDDNRVKDVESIFKLNFRHPIIYLAATVPRLRPLLRAAFFLTSAGNKIPDIFNNICKKVDERINERAVYASTHEVPQEVTDFIDLFLDVKAEQNFDNNAEFVKTGLKVTRQMTRDEIPAQCFVLLLAGFETTATSLAFVTYLLAKYPEIQQKLQAEIDQHCHGEFIDYETVVSMKYIDCVIKETLRMYPLASIANSRQCMKSTTLGDVQVKEGEFVLVDTFSIHFDHNLWGEDADKFYPERWLNTTERPLVAFLPFGIGPRQCIGIRLAMMEIKLVLAHLLKQFDIVETEGTEVSIFC